jgi:hypothetical protein
VTARIDPGGAFKFVPGQYATLGIEKDGADRTSLFDRLVPAEQEIEFFFELVPEGASPLLYRLQSGDELLMRKVPRDGSCWKRTPVVASSAGFHGDGRGAVRKLRANFAQRVARGELDGSHKLYLLNGAEPSMGVWVSA